MYLYEGTVKKSGVVKNIVLLKTMLKDLQKRHASSAKLHRLSPSDSIHDLAILRIYAEMNKFKGIGAGEEVQEWQDVCEIDELGGKRVVNTSQQVELLVLTRRVETTEWSCRHEAFLPSPFGDGVRPTILDLVPPHLKERAVEKNVRVWNAISLLLPTVEFEAKYRETGEQLRDLPPQVEGSRLLWRLPRPYFVVDISSTPIQEVE